MKIFLNDTLIFNEAMYTGLSGPDALIPLILTTKRYYIKVFVNDKFWCETKFKIPKRYFQGERYYFSMSYCICIRGRMIEVDCSPGYA
ncbi:hypothetical protein JW935_17400 [candidate division KSB1 bacterium]|nr:hypothetical protein [candidate division KSB1 bacterium]